MGKVIKLGVHRPPKGLDPKYHAEFLHIVAQLAELAASADPETVARLAKVRVDEKETSAIIDRAGKMVTGQKGNQVRHPLTGSLNELRARATRLEAELGVNLAARHRITGRRPSLEPEPESDQGFLMRLLLANREPNPVDMARLVAIAAERKRRRRR